MPKTLLRIIPLICSMVIGGAFDAARAQDAAPQADRDRADAEEAFARALEAESPAIEARQARIEAELKVLAQHPPAAGDHAWAAEWAGQYYTGDGLGMNVMISLAPGSGLTYTWHGCMGLYDGNHGDIVEVLPDGLRLKLVLDEKAASFRFMSSRLYFVRWGADRFVVPEAQMIKLVNNYNEGGWARRTMYDIPARYHEGQRTRRADGPAREGRPELPEQYARMLIDKPIHLTVTGVTPVTDRVITKGVRAFNCRVEFDGGRDQGVYEGMELKLDAGAISGTITIDRVEARTCAGTLAVFGDEDDRFAPPAPGQVFRYPAKTPEDPADPDGK